MGPKLWQPAVLTLITFMVLATSFLAYARQFLYRDPHGLFFNKNRAFQRRYSQQRQDEALDFLAERTQTTLNSSQLSVEAESTPRLCLVLPSFPRSGLERQYLEPAVGSLLANLSALERKELHIEVYIPSLNPHHHPSYMTGWFSNLLDGSFSYADSDGLISEEMAVRLDDLGTAEAFQTKNPLDYSFAMERCLTRTTAPYIAVFEDDIIVADSWLSRTLQALDQIDTRQHTQPEHDWLFMRLFLSEYYNSWASSKIYGHHELPIIVSVDALILGLVFLSRRYLRGSFVHHIDNGVLMILTLLVVPFSVVLFFQIGKYYVVPSPEGLVAQRFGCCSQALAFNRRQVPSLISYLRAQPPGQYDIQTENFAREQGLALWANYPMMVQHVGLQSAVKATFWNAQIVWSMAFEDMNAGKLAREHQQIVAARYTS